MTPDRLQAFPGMPNARQRVYPITHLVTVPKLTKYWKEEFNTIIEMMGYPISAKPDVDDFR